MTKKTMKLIKHGLKVGSILLSVCQLSCASFLAKLKSPEIFVVTEETIFPKYFDNAEHKKGFLDLNTRLLGLKQINRDKSPAREGPGANFPLGESFDYGEHVMVSASRGVWRKVVSVSRPKRGWVHHRRLAPAENQPQSIRVPIAKFEKIFAISEVDTLYSYQKEHAVRVSIPKGRGFPLLKRRDDKSLIWISETNSLAWADQSRVQ